MKDAARTIKAPKAKSYPLISGLISFRCSKNKKVFAPAAYLLLFCLKSRL
jgi:hypothetical protein